MTNLNKIPDIILYHRCHHFFIETVEFSVRKKNKSQAQVSTYEKHRQVIIKLLTGSI